GRALLPPVLAADAQRPEPRGRRAQDRGPGEDRRAAQEDRGGHAAAPAADESTDEAAADRRGEASSPGRHAPHATAAAPTAAPAARAFARARGRWLVPDRRGFDRGRRRRLRGLPREAEGRSE